jgi:multisubunit Na+/H+ antiporter MnhC subunit
MLLIALALAWGIYLIVISQNGGRIVSTETNRFILYGEIILTALIITFAFIVISLELKRMSTKRRDDRLNK